MATIKDTYQVDSKADTGGIKQAAGAVGILKSALNAVKAVGAAPFKAIDSAIKGVGSAIKGISTAPFKALGGAISGIGKGLGVFGLAVEGFKQAQEMLAGVVEGMRTASPAFAAATDRIGERLNSFKDVLFRNLGDAFAPLMEKLASILESPAFTEFFNTVQRFVFDVLQKAVPIVSTLIGFLAGGDSIQPFFDALKSVVGADVATVISDIVIAVQTLIQAITTGDWSIFTGFLDNVGFDTPLIDALMNALADVVAFVQDNWPKVQQAFEQVGAKVSEIVGGLAAIIGQFIAEHGPEIEAFFKRILATVGQILGDIYKIVMTVLAAVAKFINENQGEIKRIIETVWNIISTSVGTVINTIAGVIRAVLQVLQGDWSGAWNTIKTTFEGVWNGLVTIVTNVWNLIKGIVGGAINGIIGMINGLIYEINKAVIWSNNTFGTSWHGLDYLGYVSFAQGGIVSRPTAAVVGDNPRSSEVVAPLHELLPMIQQAVQAAGAGGITVNVYGPFGPGYTPEDAGRRAGEGVFEALRQRGLRRN